MPEILRTALSLPGDYREPVYGSEIADKAAATGLGVYRGGADMVQYPLQGANWLADKAGAISHEDAARYHEAIGRETDTPFFLSDEARAELTDVGDRHPNYSTAGEVTADMLLGQALFKQVPKVILKKGKKLGDAKLKQQAKQRAKQVARNATLGTGWELGIEPQADKFLDPNKED
ncbi:MAG: hypothetical protein MUP73_00485 [Dehalococcoidia bacterium]|nr:hypothetical protein [Dehalococcoidia bacterium]